MPFLTNGFCDKLSRQIDELLESKRNKIVLVAEPAVDFWVPLEAHLGAFEGFQVAFGHPSFLVVVGELLKLILSCLKNKRHADQYRFPADLDR